MERETETERKKETKGAEREGWRETETETETEREELSFNTSHASNVRPLHTSRTLSLSLSDLELLKSFLVFIGHCQ